MALCEHLLFDFEACKNYSNEILKLWQESPEYIDVYKEQFLNSANTTFYNFFALRDTEQS